MEKNKRLGIWMDHSYSFLLELTNDTIVQSTVESELSQEDKDGRMKSSEKLIHKKENNLQLNYYRKLGDKIRNYNEVVLFGPTEAKNELLNLLKADHLFDKIKIVVKQSDKMTENQMLAFVREYFS